MATAGSYLCVDLGAADLASRLRALSPDELIPVERWRFTPRHTVAGRAVLSTTRLVDLAGARDAWTGAARVTLWPLTAYHGHLLIGWTCEGQSATPSVAFTWDRSAWSPVGGW